MTGIFLHRNKRTLILHFTYDKQCEFSYIILYIINLFHFISVFSQGNAIKKKFNVPDCIVIQFLQFSCTLHSSSLMSLLFGSSSILSLSGIIELCALCTFTLSMGEFSILTLCVLRPFSKDDIADDMQNLELPSTTVARGVLEDVVVDIGRFGQDGFNTGIC